MGAMARLNELSLMEFVQFFMKVCFLKHRRPAIGKFDRNRTSINLSSMLHMIAFSDIPFIFGENNLKLMD